MYLCINTLINKSFIYLLINTLILFTHLSNIILMYLNMIIIYYYY
jgi:hypothetical protein